MSALREENVQLREQIKTLKNKGMILFINNISFI